MKLIGPNFGSVYSRSADCKCAPCGNPIIEAQPHGRKFFYIFGCKISRIKAAFWPTLNGIKVKGEKRGKLEGKINIMSTQSTPSNPEKPTITKEALLAAIDELGRSPLKYAWVGKTLAETEFKRRQRAGRRANGTFGKPKALEPGSKS